MKLLAFSIYDEKAGIFNNPFFFATKGLATRAFSDLVLDERSMIAQHPSDFKLYCLGEFDQVTGEFISKLPEFMAHATDFIVKKGEPNVGKED